MHSAERATGSRWPGGRRDALRFRLDLDLKKEVKPAPDFVTSLRAIRPLGTWQELSYTHRVNMEAMRKKKQETETRRGASGCGSNHPMIPKSGAKPMKTHVPPSGICRRSQQVPWGIA